MFQSTVQDKDEIKDTIKQISNGGHRSLKLGGEKEKCVGSCTKPSVHEGCKYGVNCQVPIIFCLSCTTKILFSSTLLYSLAIKQFLMHPFSMYASL